MFAELVSRLATVINGLDRTPPPTLASLKGSLSDILDHAEAADTEYAKEASGHAQLTAQQQALIAELQKENADLKAHIERQAQQTGWDAFVEKHGKPLGRPGLEFEG